MIKSKRSLRPFVPFLILLLAALAMTVKSHAREEKISPAASMAVTDKATSLDPTNLPADNGEALKKTPVLPKTPPKSEKYTEHSEGKSVAPTKNDKREVEQDIMERALELVSTSQEFWVNGDIESALDTLDQAYAILLDTNGDVEIARQKDDLRLLISKKILAIYTAKQTVTTGKRSEVPMIMNAEVEKEIRSFQTVEKDFFISSYQRSFFFRPTIVEALKKAGLPEELSWLPLVESGFKIRALSKARALGLWQFIPSTGYKYGLNRDDWVDERMDVEKSTQGAIGYLKDLHDMFGDWLTVLAAYNCGEGRVLRVISRQHINYLDRFWDLYSQLPNETARYVPRLLATLHIIKDPQKYGFNFENPAEKPPAYVYNTVTTNKCMNLDVIANRLNVSEDLLCTLNAELRHQKTPDKEYRLKIPPDAMERLVSIMDEIPLSEKPRTTEGRRIGLIRHKVKKGETFASIAKRYKTTVSAIKSSNKHLSKNALKSGSHLMIPIQGSRTVKSAEDKETNVKKTQTSEEYARYKVKKGDTIFSLAKRFEMTVSELKKLNNLKGNNLKIGATLKVDKKAALSVEKGQKNGHPPEGVAKSAKAEKTTGEAPGAPKTYVVKRGDNLKGIAQKNGSNVEKLMQLNSLENKNNLQPGQVLVVR